MKAVADVTIVYKPALHERIVKMKPIVQKELEEIGVEPHITLMFDDEPSTRYINSASWSCFGNHAGSVLIRYRNIEPKELSKLEDDEWSHMVTKMDKESMATHVYLKKMAAEL